MKDLGNFLVEISQRLLGEKQEVITEESDEHSLILLEKARQDWLAAVALFNSVCERDLVDHAIYNLNAAERRYVFLFKEARKRDEMQKNS